MVLHLQVGQFGVGVYIHMSYFKMVKARLGFLWKILRENQVFYIKRFESDFSKKCYQTKHISYNNGIIFFLVATIMPHSL